MMAMRWLARPKGSWSMAGRSRVRMAAGPSLARSAHNVASLDNHLELEQRGVPDLLSAKAFQTAYTEYQKLMVDELNVCTAGTALESVEIKSLVLQFARDPMKAYAFNVASMAFNNHFFFHCLNTRPAVQSQPSKDLEIKIKEDFSSLDTLRETFLTTAEAMFGPGFVWLVQTDNTQFGSLCILSTYLAGSPLSGAHHRRQSHDLSAHNVDSYQAMNPVGAFGSAAKQSLGPKKPLGGIDVMPLLCVNTWEHVWLHDYGVRGKRDYLEAWWERIDWDIVRQNAHSLKAAPRGAFVSR